jgi:hypothetical protein
LKRRAIDKPLKVVEKIAVRATVNTVVLSFWLVINQWLKKKFKEYCKKRLSRRKVSNIIRFVGVMPDKISLFKLVVCWETIPCIIRLLF